MRDFSGSHEAMSLNTATVRKQWDLVRIVDECARLGIRNIAPWRDQVAHVGIERLAAQLKSLDIGLSGYVRGGLFTAADAAGRQAALDDNRRALDEACRLGAPCLVIVAGGLPGALTGNLSSRDIADARRQVRDGIATLLIDARERGMPLAIEPLHPMYAADRACINTLAQALDLCAELEPAPTPGKRFLGVAIDAYHTWWDPSLRVQVERAGREQRVLAFHVCDWLVPTTDLLNDRGMMGDGVIDLKQLRGWVEATGFDGLAEVEIFSNRWWAEPGELVLTTCVERFRSCV
ncbi:MAG: sugar phosphate isomerase/epimerase family protein [Lautropia sp.]